MSGKNKNNKDSFEFSECFQAQSMSTHTGLIFPVFSFLFCLTCQLNSDRVCAAVYVFGCCGEYWLGFLDHTNDESDFDPQFAEAIQTMMKHLSNANPEEKQKMKKTVINAMLECEGDKDSMNKEELSQFADFVIEEIDKKALSLSGKRKAGSI